MVRYAAAVLLYVVCEASFAGAFGSQIEDMNAKKSLSRASLEMWSSTTPFTPSDVFAPHYRNHQEPLADGGVKTIDRSTWEAVVKANHDAFPDLAVTILSQIGEGDRVATHWRFTATQTGPYEGKDPTGDQVSWSGVQIDRFEDGKIAESWVVWDKFTLFETLGLLEK